MWYLSSYNGWLTNSARTLRQIRKTIQTNQSQIRTNKQTNIPFSCTPPATRAKWCGSGFSDMDTCYVHVFIERISCSVQVYVNYNSSTRNFLSNNYENRLLLIDRARLNYIYYKHDIMYTQLSFNDKYTENL